MGKEGSESRDSEEAFATRQAREKAARRELLEALMRDSNNPADELKSIHDKHKKKSNRPAA